MAAYGLDIRQVMQWSYPQLRLISTRYDARIKEERRWQLVLAAGSLGQEAFDSLWEQLGGDPIPRSAAPSAGRGGQKGQQSLPVDAQGNVIAPTGALALWELDPARASTLPFPIATRYVKENSETADGA